MQNSFMISYDVTSLFTNIPLNETLDIAVNEIIKNEPNIKMNKKELKKLFIFATSESHFIFNNKIYDQIDGVTMGSALGPVLANLFMGHHEENWIKDYPSDGPEIYKRFMDDIFCLFENEKQADLFFQYLNNQHPNIKFTFEKQNNDRLPFLDININLNNQGSFWTSIYRKPTFTGLFTNFKSFVPFSYKLALINTLIHRVYKICNSWTLFHNDICNLTKILKRNSYPPKLINRQINKYLNKQYIFSNNTCGKDVEKEINKYYFKIPFIGKKSKETKIRISEISQRYCKNLKVITCFSLLKIGSFFSVKDKTPTAQKSSIVYLFSCAGCNASYIGETIRKLSDRADEHLNSGKSSVIFDHLKSSKNCNDKCDLSSFKIIDSAQSEFRLKLKEAIHIRLKKPSLNKQIKHEFLNITI